MKKKSATLANFSKLDAMRDVLAHQLAFKAVLPEKVKQDVKMAESLKVLRAQINTKQMLINALLKP